MSLNKELNDQLMAKENYERKILAFKIYDDIPQGIEFYGNDMSMLCAIAAEAWGKPNPFYVTKENCVCGGSLYAGIGSRKVSKEEREVGMSVLFGEGAPYGSKTVFRKVGQQIPKHHKHHKYLVMGGLDKIENPDLVHITGNANQIYKLTKSYTWETGELVHGLSGTSWCAQALPGSYRDQKITFTLGDHGGRSLMGVKDYELFCTIPYKLLPMVVRNLDKAL